MSEIQKAREVLAKWREEVQSRLPWRITGQGNEMRDVVDADGVGIVSLWSREESSNAHLYDGDDRLIVGTAGNPELLEAIDECLEVGADYADLFEGVLPPTGAPGRVLAHAKRIAAAILSADERMRS